jgi:transposase
MNNPRYPEEFKIEAVCSGRTRSAGGGGSCSFGSLYAWVKRYSKPQEQRTQEDDQHAELRRLRAELKRITEETS